jgi:hypothetical protein
MVHLYKDHMYCFRYKAVQYRHLLFVGVPQVISDLHKLREVLNVCYIPTKITQQVSSALQVNVD